MASLDALPEDVLEMILLTLHSTGRSALARASHAMRRVFHSCRWAGLTCSMHRLVQRSRYCEVPHWTADTFALLRLLQRPMFERLKYLRLLIDTPCFDSSQSPWVHPSTFKKLDPLPLTTLDVEAVRRHYARPSSHAMHRLVTLCPHLTTISLTKIRNLGNETIKALLQKDRCLVSLRIRDCSFTETARNTLVRRMSSADGAAGNTTQWPSTLLHLEMTGRAVESVVRTVSRILHDLPMNLPTNLAQLDMHGAIEMLQDVQLLMTISFLPNLRDMVLHEKHYQTFDMLHAFQPSLFPYLRFFM